MGAGGSGGAPQPAAAPVALRRAGAWAARADAAAAAGDPRTDALLGVPPAGPGTAESGGDPGGGGRRIPPGGDPQHARGGGPPPARVRARSGSVDGGGNAPPGAGRP